MHVMATHLSVSSRYIDGVGISRQLSSRCRAAAEPQHSSLGGCDVVVHKKRRQKRLSLGQCPLKQPAPQRQRSESRKHYFKPLGLGLFRIIIIIFDGYYSSLVLSEQSVLVPMNKRL